MNRDQMKINELYRDCEGMKDEIAKKAWELGKLSRDYYSTLGELEVLCKLTGLKASLEK